jgi:transposase-like protein
MTDAGTIDAEQTTNTRSCPRCGNDVLLSPIRIARSEYVCNDCERKRNKEMRLNGRVTYNERNREHNRSKFSSLYKLAVEKLGSKCGHCGLSDKRVLQVNHLKENVDGIIRRVLDVPSKTLYRMIVDGAADERHVSLLCANCNIIYEYEVGARKECVN